MINIIILIIVALILLVFLLYSCIMICRKSIENKRLKILEEKEGVLLKEWE